MATVFLSDRRTYTMTFTARIAERLEARLGAGSVLNGLPDPPPADDEARAAAIEAALRPCAAMLVIIGRDWLESRTDDGTRRLDDPSDPVRREIEAALTLGLTLIPVLVDGAPLPATADLPPSLLPLASAQAQPVRNGPEFRRDTDQLLTAVESASARQAAARAFAERAASAPSPTPGGEAARPLQLSAAPAVQRKARGVAGIPRPLLIALAAVLVLAACAALVFSGALAPKGGPLPGQPGSGISPAQATRTGVALATQTVLASPRLPYFAAAPGPQCDPGYFPWQSRVGGYSFHGTITCSPDHTHVTGTAGCSSCGDGGFSYTVGSAMQLPDPFTVSVQVSHLGSDSNAFLETSLDALNNDGVEVIELDSPNIGSAYASLFDRGKVPVGTITAATGDTHTLAITIHGSSATFMLDGQVIGTRTEPQPLHVLVFVLTMQTKDSRGGGQVDFSNFSIHA